MPSSEIITIGSEILLGELVDTNSAHIAKSLRNAGIDLFRLTTIGDNINRIVTAIKEGISRSDIVITTGGLGPTVDDPTREAVAKTFRVGLEYNEELWQHIDQRIRSFGRIPGENQRRQAFIPHGARILHNPVGTAPAFIFEKEMKCVISLPGVPSEMEFLLHHNVLPYLIEKFSIREIIKVRIIKTFNIGEGLLDEKIADLEKLENPTVGLSAHFGMSDIRITAKAGTFEEADKMISLIEDDLRNRIGTAIYGVDDETIQDAIVAEIVKKRIKIGVFMPNVKGLEMLIAKATGFIFHDEFLKAETSFSSISDENKAGMITIMQHNTLKTEKQKIFAGNATYYREWHTNQSFCDLLKFIQDLE